MNTKELSQFFKSIIDQDRCAVVICNLAHEIIYMNPTAVQRYAKRGGAALVGQSLLDCHNAQSVAMIEKVVDWFSQSIEHNIIYTFRNEKENKDIYMVALRDEDGTLIGYYEKHEYRDVETGGLYDFT
ncbi:MAG: PAS domain-containing protein [Lachnospiraceae bacterium]|nr:PAS domain-containing protein [Lachnospiraceae bacterium]